uniref:Uncharacterized protein n=2 Tax=Hemiselmis andersenii TaxID=464988 RepID=A0A7S0XUB1_HEMAN
MNSSCCSVTDFLIAAEKVLGVDKRAVLDEEFATYVDLKMSLHLPPKDILSHFQRILQSLDMNNAEYFGSSNITFTEAEGLAQVAVMEELALEPGDMPVEEIEELRQEIKSHVKRATPWLMSDSKPSSESNLDDITEAGRGA